MNVAQSLWPGWETVRQIGRGSYGAVYEIQRKLFEDDTEPERAALKVISIPQNDSDIKEMYSDGYDDESVTSTFRDHLKGIVAEYSLMRKMNGSANVVNCDDVRYIQHDDGIGWDIFIKMELLTPLPDALPTSATEEQVIKIAMDLCAALDLCSKHSIIHRDIKPQNIFVSENGDYKLGDFGIAKTVEKTMGGTKTGTYKYMAPEVYNNQPYSNTADICSLGLVLYWLLNERRMPFMPLPPEKLKADVDRESRSRRMSGEQIPAPKNGSEGLKQIVLKACAFEPKDRYQSALEMREDLLRLSGNPFFMSASSLAKEQHAAQNTDFIEEATVGPIFKQNTASIADDHDKIAGPVFSQPMSSIVTSAAVHNHTADVTGGESAPVSEAAQEGSSGKQKKSKVPLLIAIVAGLILLGLILSSLGGKKTTQPVSTEIPQQTQSSSVQQKSCVVTVSTVASSGKVKLTWEAIEGAKEYQVYRATSKDGEYTQLKTATGTSFINTSANAGESYYYKVRPVFKNGLTSDWSNIVSQTCNLPQPVVKVANVAATGKAQLTWDKIEGAKEYRVYSSPSKDGEYKLIKTTTNTTCTNVSAKAGEFYYYKVMAIHSTKSANSAYSEVVSRTCDLPQPVVKVANVAATGKAQLTWDKIEGAKEYKVYSSPSKDGEYKLIKTTTNTTCTNVSAKAGEFYYYKVMAIHSTKSANSAYSEVVSRTCDLPQPKVKLKLNYEGVLMSWGKISGAKEYKIYRSSSKNGEYTLLKTVTGTSYLDTTVKYTQTYYYKVKAIHSINAADSAYSDITSIKIK